MRCEVTVSVLLIWLALIVGFVGGIGWTASMLQEDLQVGGHIEVIDRHLQQTDLDLRHTESRLAQCETREGMRQVVRPVVVHGVVLNRKPSE